MPHLTILLPFVVAFLLLTVSLGQYPSDPSGRA